jgi:hypothetical protein
MKNTWVLETGVQYLGSPNTRVDRRQSFTSRKAATKAFDHWVKHNPGGGQGYWHHMPVPWARVTKG